MAKKTTGTTRQNKPTFRHSLAGSHLTLTPQPARRQGEAEAQRTALTELSAKTRKLIDDVKQNFVDYSIEFGAIVQSRAEFAPRFMKAFHAYEKEVENATFISFVRLLDPSVPVNRDGYRAHSSYQAAENLRQLERAAKTEPKGSEDDGPKAATPLQALARLIATVAPLIEGAEVIFGAFVKELHWSEMQVIRLQAMIEEATPKPSVLRTGTRG